MRRAQPEAALQRAIRDFIAAAGFDSVHVPNGARLAGTSEQRARTGARLKREGVRPGFPDLIVYGRGQRIGHIEVKTQDGRLLPSQAAVRDWLEGMGHKYAVCRSVDDAARALRLWGWI